jgi:ABC-2 type transport system ATP-binding protein
MVRELSLGERMKMELIASLLHNPRVLFLDEPTIGLDVTAQKNIREFIRGYNRARKTTILLTSHYMNDIQALCDRVIIINHGKKFFDGSLSEVVGRFSQTKMVKVIFEKEVADRGQLAAFGEVVDFSGNKASLKVGREEAAKVSNGLLNKFQVADITIEEVPIEEVIGMAFASAEG